MGRLNSKERQEQSLAVPLERFLNTFPAYETIDDETLGRLLWLLDGLEAEIERDRLLHSVYHRIHYRDRFTTEIPF